ncbi:aspartate aminotransferase family protein [Paraburkholderia silviterrae]|uniref:Diaminobutyrate--2-oxoglutarate transaminase n=1 Tax=Paraburkholderia silviterrae TaxID=2528715 RepID=A0A4R5M0L0_9BURK|nr:aminotransferase class III-fold pyridoxal phosphate-dependent enzyme [Paraburkholderia silviterrae]TDG18683.1 aminotransferase class III-fold pyridoxal phosphate-dependent enzyme [Paraburkholderia silviterrae]
MGTKTDEYERFVNPAWSDVVQLAGLNTKPVSASGSWITMQGGSRFLDFVSGYGAMPFGHHLPALLYRLSNDLHSPLPNLNPLGISFDAGALAAQLIELSGLPDGKVYFGSSGVEAVDAALKFAMVHTRRKGILTIGGGFHGLSHTATWLAGNSFWRRNLTPPPEDFKQVDFGDVAAIRAHLARKDVAAVLLEPVQGTAGARVWNREDLADIASECDLYGTVLIFDEILSGLGRTGDWFAYQTLRASPPQMVLLSKALTGGLFPVSAVLMRNSIYQSMFGREGAAKIHGSTFSGNRLGMRCGLHVLTLLRELKLRMNVCTQGERLRNGIEHAGASLGLRCDGIGLALSIRTTPECLRHLGDAVAARLWHALLNKNVLTIPAAHDPASIRLLPPLNVTASEIDFFIQAYEAALLDMQNEQEAT